MPVQPWIDPKAQQSFERPFDGKLHNAGDPLVPAGVRLSQEELFGPRATCDACGRWQRFGVVPTQTTAAQMAAAGWTNRAGRDLCPVCSGSQRS